MNPQASQTDSTSGALRELQDLRASVEASLDQAVGILFCTHRAPEMSIEVGDAIGAALAIVRKAQVESEQLWKLQRAALGLAVAEEGEVRA